jgi:aldehyde dehydrogenase (NAD+)
MQWDIDLIDRYEWERELGNHEFFGLNSNRLVIREPIGVVGAVTPWNFPFMLNLSKITPALAAGCTVVLKPAPDTPYAATWIGRLVAEETDIPAGVFNVVTASDPAAVGDVLTGSELVDMISFTGSTAVGKHIAARGADTLKRVFLELGGKSAGAAGLGHGVHALGSGLRHHHPAPPPAFALRRGRRDGEGRVRELPLR